MRSSVAAATGGADLAEPNAVGARPATPCVTADHPVGAPVSSLSFAAVLPALAFMVLGPTSVFGQARVIADCDDCSLELEHVVRLGSLDDSVSFTPFSMVVQQSDGAFLVAPTFEPGTFAVFSPDGTYLRSVGRPGQGPGEMRGVQRIMTWRDSIFVATHGFMHVFSSDYRYVRRFPLAALHHNGLVQDPPGGLATRHEDAQGEAPEVPRIPRRLVPEPPTPAAQGATRRAQQTATRALSVLRGEREPPLPRSSAVSGYAAVAQVVAPSESTRKTSDLEAVQRLPQGVPASPAPSHGTDLGSGSVRLLDGGAEWWKSPRSDLRGPGRATARATRPPRETRSPRGPAR